MNPSPDTPPEDAPAAPGDDAHRIAHYLEMRAVTIRYLRMLEAELVNLGGLRPQQRACLTRDERRALRRKPEGIS